MRVRREGWEEVTFHSFSTKHRRLLSHSTIKYTQLGEFTLKGALMVKITINLMMDLAAYSYSFLLLTTVNFLHCKSSSAAKAEQSLGPPGSRVMQTRASIFSS